jgi:glycosyltransferase involved in cell wall biosynthesis
MAKRLTVLCPVFNEEAAIPLFFARVQRVFDQLKPRYVTALVFLNNGSTDSTSEIIDELCRKHPHVFAFTMSRNFGYQASIDMGLRSARGDLFSIIDVDCEDPPEMLLDFLDLHEEGYHLVYGQRVDRHENSIIKFGRKIFYHLAKTISDEPFILEMAEFFLITSQIRDAVIQEKNSFPFIRSAVARSGFRSIGIPYKREKRIVGKTHYNLLGMTIFAVAGILSSSTFFLRLPLFLFPFWLVSMLGLFIAHIFYSSQSALVLMQLLGFLFCGFSCAFIAVYVARIYKNALLRPNAIIDRENSYMQPEATPNHMPPERNILFSETK